MTGTSGHNPRNHPTGDGPGPCPRRAGRSSLDIPSAAGSSPVPALRHLTGPRHHAGRLALATAVALVAIALELPAAELQLEEPAVTVPSVSGGGDKQYRYTAVLQARAKHQGTVKAAGIRWKCSGNRCTTRGPWPRPGVRACNALAKQVGRVRSYGHSKKKLSRARIKQCNRGVEVAKDSGGSKSTLGLGDATGGAAASSLSKDSDGADKGALSGGSAGTSLAAPRLDESAPKVSKDLGTKPSTGAAKESIDESLGSGSLAPSLSEGGGDLAPKAPEPKLAPDATGALGDAQSKTLEPGTPELSGFTAPEPEGGSTTSRTQTGTNRAGGSTAPAGSGEDSGVSGSGGFAPPEDLQPKEEAFADAELQERVELRTPLDLRTERLVVVGIGGEATEIPDEVPSLSVSTETLVVTGVGGEPTEIPETVDALDVRTEALIVTGSD